MCEDCSNKHAFMSGANGRSWAIYQSDVTLKIKNMDSLHFHFRLSSQTASPNKSVPFVTGWLLCKPQIFLVQSLHCFEAIGNPAHRWCVLCRILRATHTVMPYSFTRATMQYKYIEQHIIYGRWAWKSLHALCKLECLRWIISLVGVENDTLMHL